MLVEVSARLRKALRSSDQVIRLGGDEFAIILENVTTKENTSQVAQKLILSLSDPYFIDSYQIQLTASIGINILNRSELDEADLMVPSDIAMYQVKEAGKNSYRFFTSEGDDTQVNKLDPSQD